MPLLACTACIDLGFQYRYPYLGYALAISFIWFGIEAFRPTSSTSVGRHYLMFWLLALASIWFTLCMTPMAWGGFTGIVTGFFTLKALVSSKTPKARRHLAGLSLAGLVVLAACSAWTYSRSEHHIVWLGRLPTHGPENRRPSQHIRSRGNQVAPLLMHAAEYELFTQSQPDWVRRGALAREIARLNLPDALTVMTRFRDQAIETIQSTDDRTAGLDTTILACGEFSNSRLTDHFAQLAEKKLLAKQDYEALILVTALGLSDRETAIRWKEAHPMNDTAASSFTTRRQMEALELLWTEIKKGPVAPELMQNQLDAFPPQVD